MFLEWVSLTHEDWIGFQHAGISAQCLSDMIIDLDMRSVFYFQGWISQNVALYGWVCDPYYGGHMTESALIQSTWTSIGIKIRIFTTSCWLFWLIFYRPSSGSSFVKPLCRDHTFAPWESWASGVMIAIAFLLGAILRLSAGFLQRVFWLRL